jgi:hypothetical protein
MTLVDPTAKVDAQSCDAQPLTEFEGHPERCSNPFCDAPMAAKNKYAPVKLFCSDLVGWMVMCCAVQRRWWTRLALSSLTPFCKGQVFKL